MCQCDAKTELVNTTEVNRIKHHGTVSSPCSGNITNLVAAAPTKEMCVSCRAKRV